MSSPLTVQQLDEIEAAITAYQQHPPIGFACCTAHAVADQAPALLAEICRLKGQRKYLLGVLAKRDAETGDGDKALREFLSGDPDADAEDVVSSRG